MKKLETINNIDVYCDEDANYGSINVCSHFSENVDEGKIIFLPYDIKHNISVVSNDYVPNMVINSRYSTVDLKNEINLPSEGKYYSNINSTKINTEYDEFMEQYHFNHECCPVCNDTSCRSTLVGYVLDMNKKEEYKDLNRCICSKCGNTHTTHDRIKMRVDFEPTIPVVEKRKFANVKFIIVSSDITSEVYTKFIENIYN